MTNKQRRSKPVQADLKSKQTKISPPPKQTDQVNPEPRLQRALAASSAALKPSDLPTLQQASGNRAVNRLLVQRAQPTQNKTGLPDKLKAGVEQLSGLPLDDVKVHYNSAKPAEVDALAYTQGTEIHMGPGQEKFLAHEAWHVVQQKQGRVTPTLQMKNVSINNNQGLEREADIIGSRAARLSVTQPQASRGNETRLRPYPTWATAGQRGPARVIQRVGNIAHFAFLAMGWVLYSLYNDYLIRKEDYTSIIGNIPLVAQEIFNAAKEASGSGGVDSELIKVVAQGALAERNLRMDKVRGKISYIGLWLSRFMKAQGLTYAQLYAKYHKEGDTDEAVNMKIISGAGKANPDLVGKFLSKLGVQKKAKL